MYFSIPVSVSILDLCYTGPRSILFQNVGPLLTIWTFVHKLVSLLFSTLSRFVIACLPRSKHFLISWLQLPSIVIFRAQEKVCHCFHCFPIYLPWKDGTRCHDLWFLNVVFWASLLTLLFHLHQEPLVLFTFAIKVVPSAYLRLLIFLLGNFDSSLYFIQPGILHDVLCI